MEIILSYVEFINYQKFANELLEQNTTNKYADNLPDNMPESGIITQYKNESKLSDIEKCKLISYELYLKYIKVGAIYEINIRSSTRKTFSNLMNNKDNWINNININNDELCVLFNECCYEMRLLMGYSLTRAVLNPKLLAALNEV